MKKIIIWAIILALSFTGMNLSFAANWDYGIFSDFIREDLSETEKTELEALLERQATCSQTLKWLIEKVKAWEVDAFEEFAKVAPNRKALTEELKVYAKNPEDFQYLCMNMWDELIANLFADSALVSKYKLALLNKYKDYLSEIYSKKGRDLEFSIHKLYHKYIDAKDIKMISFVRAVELIIEDIKKTWETSFTTNSGLWKNILVDGNGNTLYTFKNDTENVSNCYGECEVKWPVFYGWDIKDTDFWTIERTDGTMQTTYKGQPLYYFFKDEKAWDTNGQNVNNIWFVVEK